MHTHTFLIGVDVVFGFDKSAYYVQKFAECFRHTFLIGVDVVFGFDKSAYYVQKFAECFRCSKACCSGNFFVFEFCVGETQSLRGLLG